MATYLPKSNLVPKLLLFKFQKELNNVKSKKCKCKKVDGEKCMRPEICTNVNLRVECPTSCGKSCQNQRIRNGLINAPIKKETVNDDVGYGVIAQGEIMAGTVICEYLGVLKTDAEYKVDQLKDPGRGLYGMSHLDGYVIDATEIDAIGKYLNHGCKTNCESQLWLSDGWPHILIVATRKIRKGEWLLFDYNLHTYKGHERFKCRCGKQGCVDEDKKLKSAVVSLPRLKLCQEKSVQNQYSCDVCPRKFARSKYLKAHKARHATMAREKYNCLKCGRLVWGKSRWLRHKRTHMQLKTQGYKCPSCDRIFPVKAARDRHMFTHKALEQWTFFSCKMCPQRFPMLEELDHHERKHNGQAGFVCTKCARVFSCAASLARHKKAHKSFPQCTRCFREFPNRLELDVHLKSVHPEYKIFQCVFCRKTFNRRNTLNRHIKIHISEIVWKRHSCSVCSRVFSTKSNLTRHMELHASRRILKRCLVQTETDRHHYRNTYSRGDNLLAHVHRHH